MDKTIKLSISSTFDCLLMADKKIFMKADYTTVELEVNSNDCFFVYPTARGISYAVVLENGKVVEKDCIDITKYFDNEYHITLNSYEYLLPPHKIEAKVYGESKMSLIFSKPTLIQVENQNTTYFCKIEQDFEYFEFLNMGGMPSVLLKNDDYDRLVYFDKSKFKSVKGEIKINGDKIQTITPLMDISHRAKIINYLVKEKSLHKIDEDLIYLDNEPIYPSQQGLIPFAFFEAVKCGDVHYAKNLLGEELKNQISSDMLNDYFGDFDNILPYNYNKEKGYFIALTSKNNNQIYRILMENQKIVEIEKLLRVNGIDRFE